MKLQMVGLLRCLGDYELFKTFMQLQRRCLEMGGVDTQFLKIDVGKFLGLIKARLSVHAVWSNWLKAPLQMSQDYSSILTLWHFAYERLHRQEGVRPPALDLRMARIYNELRPIHQGGGQSVQRSQRTAGRAGPLRQR